MISFSEAFGRNLLSISDGRGRGHNHTGCDDSKNFLTRTDVNPFQAMDRMVLNMQNSIYAKKKKNHLSVDTDRHSFSSLSVII